VPLARRFCLCRSKQIARNPAGFVLHDHEATGINLLFDVLAPFSRRVIESLSVRDSLSHCFPRRTVYHGRGVEHENRQEKGISRTMNTAAEQARHFLDNEKAFRLGMLPTEGSHPATASLSGTIAANTADGVRMMLRVDEQIAPVMERVVASREFSILAEAVEEAVSAGRRVFFTGCGSTGRLAILLEAAWRGFWQDLFVQRPQLRAQLPNPEDSIVSVMAGGDFALVSAVEGFEDATALGRYQLAQAGVGYGDAVVAVTEGGETPFVIGTAWQGLDVGARTFFVYNNPTDVLRRHVVRSREVIDEPRIVKLDLYTSPMAIAGSTRMQATSAELLILVAALESAIFGILERWLSPEMLRRIGFGRRRLEDYPRLFARLVAQLSRPENLAAVAGMIEWEESLYRNKGLVTYMADRFLLDVLTDTTERTPTFRLPPFRRCDDLVAARSWAFVKNPRCDTREAWRRTLRRQPRGIDWPPSVYRSLDVCEAMRESPPKLDNSEIWKFLIGNELDPSRYNAPDSGLAMILVGEEVVERGAARETFDEAFAAHAASFARTAALGIGPARMKRGVQRQFHVACDLPHSPLRLWERLAVKLALNLMSTGTMARMGRVEGNFMSRVAASNKKLVDRGTRLVAQLADVDYDTACYALHEAIFAVSEQEKTTKDAPSPVSVAVEMLRERRRPVAGNGNGESNLADSPLTAQAR